VAPLRALTRENYLLPSVRGDLLRKLGRFDQQRLRGTHANVSCSSSALERAQATRRRPGAAVPKAVRLAAAGPLQSLAINAVAIYRIDVHSRVVVVLPEKWLACGF
jgi:hypothetical protein